MSTGARQQMPLGARPCAPSSPVREHCWVLHGPLGQVERGVPRDQARGPVGHDGRALAEGDRVTRRLGGNQDKGLLIRQPGQTWGLGGHVRKQDWSLNVMGAAAGSEQAGDTTLMCSACRWIEDGGNAAQGEPRPTGIFWKSPGAHLGGNWAALVVGAVRHPRRGL